MLGRILCLLGVHDNHLSGINATITEVIQIRSVWGACIRCNKPWQVDN